jgi:hypothetical protein
MKQMESDEKSSRSKDFSTSDPAAGARGRRAFVVCVKNAGTPAALEIGKIYRLLSDASAEARGFARVIDDSGEDYLHPANYFLPIEVPQQVQDALSLAS